MMKKKNSRAWLEQCTIPPSYGLTCTMRTLGRFSLLLDPVGTYSSSFHARMQSESVAAQTHGLVVAVRAGVVENMVGPRTSLQPCNIVLSWCSSPNWRHADELSLG